MAEVDNSAQPEVQVENTADVENTDVVVDAGEQPEEETSWVESLNENFRNDPSIQKFKSPDDLAKSYLEVQRLVGKEKIVIPAENAPDEEKAAFWNKIGRPEEAAKYETPELEMPEEVKMQEHTLEAFKNKAHELGLTKKQFSDLYGFYNEITLNSYNGELEKNSKMAGESESELRKEWGNAYETKVKGAQGVINTFFKGKELHPAFKVLSSDRGFVKAMADVAERLGEDVIQGTPRSVLTPKEAQSELNSIMADTKGAYYDDLHPEHKAIVEKVLALQSAASAS